jgi:uncharacterized protein YlaI
MKVICEECGREFEVDDDYFETQPGNPEKAYYCDECIEELEKERVRRIDELSFGGKVYTVDFRLKEFRVISKNGLSNIPFDSLSGELLLNVYLYSKITRKGKRMSLRAYRIKRIDTEKFETFNLSYHCELVSILEEETDFLDTLNSYGTGIMEIRDNEFKGVKEKLEEVINGLENTKTNQPENCDKAKEYRNILNKIEKQIKKDGYILFEIY